MKKRLHNQRRRSPRPSPPLTPRADRGSRTSKEGTAFDSGMVRYLQMVTSLIEGRRVSETEILGMLARAMRQHSIARRRRRDYVLSCWQGTVKSP